MGIYLGNNELGGGGGKARIGSLVYVSGATGDTFVDSNGQTLLKTGVVETDPTVYPDLPQSFAVTRSYDNTGNQGFGGYGFSGVEWDSMNNKPIYRAGSYANMSGYKGYLTVDETDDRFEFVNSSFHASKWYSSAPFSDGTTHYVARAYNNNTYNGSAGPRNKTSYDYPSGTHDLNIYMSPVDTYSTTLTEAITFAQSGEIQLSGTPDSGYGHWVGNFVKTPNHFYVSGWVNPSGHGYSSNLYANSNIVPITYKYNGTTGAYISSMPGEQCFADPSSPNHFFTIKSDVKPSGTPQAYTNNSTEDPFVVTRYNDSTGTATAEIIANVNMGSYYHSAHLPCIWADNQGDVYHFKKIHRPHGWGSGRKLQIASGEGIALYTRGLTDTSTPAATSADTGAPLQTSEVSGKRLYVVAK